MSYIQPLVSMKWSTYRKDSVFYIGFLMSFRCVDIDNNIIIELIYIDIGVANVLKLQINLFLCNFDQL